MVTVDIRPLAANEVGLLDDFLYLGIHQPDPDNPIPRSILTHPPVAAYLKDWGQPDDLCLVAEVDHRIIGAIWTRIIAGEVQGYGHVDAQTPEFLISVQKSNWAFRLYQRLSFTVFDEHEDDATMVYKFR